MKNNRKLTNIDDEEAQKNGWKILVPFECECIGKAVYEGEDLKIMKSTKRIKVYRGYLYNVTTEMHNKGSVSVAEAVVFVAD